VHVPFVGGTSAGKTTLMVAAIGGLLRRSPRDRLWVSFVSQDDEERYWKYHAILSRNEALDPTRENVPRAFMLWVNAPRRRRLLYLYDPRGEVYHDTSVLRSQGYLRRTSGMIFVADMLATRAVKTYRLTEAERMVIDTARGATLPPNEARERISQLLRDETMLARRTAPLPIRLAVVVSKKDALDRLPLAKPLGRTGKPAGHHTVRSWLSDVDHVGLVQPFEEDFRSVRFWAVSAHRATGSSSNHLEAAAEPLLWILGPAFGTIREPWHQ
jgi:hypothetical protein